MTMMERTEGPGLPARSGDTTVYEYDASESGFTYALNDLKQAFAQPHLILTLIRTGFLSSYPGPLQAVFWIAATTTMVVVGLSLIYGQILGRVQIDYMPYVAAGIITWGTLASLVNGGAGVFIAAASVYGQTPISKSLFALRSVGIAAVTFSVKLVVLIAVFVILQRPVSPISALLALAGFALLCWTGFWFALAWGPLAARFRDIPHLTSTMMTLAFFITPVFWRPEMLGPYEPLINFNPFHHYLHIIRGPLMGLEGVAESFLWAGGISALVTLAGLLVFGKFARRLCYWT